MFGLLRRIPGYRLLLMVLVPVGLAVAAVLALRARPAGFDVDPAERYVVERATDGAAEALAAALPMRTVLLVPLADDGDGFVTECLRARFRSVGGFEVLDRRDLGALETLAAKIRSFVAGLVGTGDLAGAEAAPAVEAARAVRAPAVVFGKVTERGTAGGRTTVEVALRAVKTEGGGTLLARAFQADLRRSWTSPAYVGVWMRARAWWARMLAWLALTGLLPLATAGLTRPLLARESNAVNAAVLGFLTLVDALAAWLLLGLAFGGAVLILVVLGAIAGGVYNYVNCDRLASAAAWGG